SRDPWSGSRVLDLLRSAVGRRHRGWRRGLALRAGEAGHELAEEARERAHQLPRHLGRERVPAKLARRAIRADERDTGRTGAEVIFQCLCAVRREDALDVFSVEVVALLAMLNSARLSVLHGGYSIVRV